MAIRTRPVERAKRRIEEDLHRVRLDLGTGRRTAGLSLEFVGEMCDVSGSTASRVENGQIRDPDLRMLAAMAATVGLELRLRAYPAGDPIRDAGQQRLIERFHVRLHAELGWRTEAPLPIEGDHRAWDALLIGRGWRVGVEAETVLEDIQAVERRVALKERDGKVDRVVLVVADTKRNRRALAGAPAAFTGFSRDARAVLRDLGRGVMPASNAIVFL